jgi:hypothetical protein
MVPSPQVGAIGRVSTRARRPVTPAHPLAIAVALALSVTARLSADQPAPATDSQLAFLKTAKVVAAKPIGKGITGALRLTLSDGSLTHDAAFQAVDQASKAQDIRQGRKRAGELMFVDSYRYNIGAWELARLIGLDYMMPATVERRHNGAIGALSWWVDDVLMDQEERERTSANPPAGQHVTLARQWQLMLIFAELVRDTDRNKGNVLYTRDWRLIMLDFTRAFRTQGVLRAPDNLLGCDRNVLAKLRTLTAADISEAAGRHLTKQEISALLQRRDLIVEHFDKLVMQRGEAAVLF